MRCKNTAEIRHIMLHSIKYGLSKQVEKHPYSWFLAWTLMHQFNFLLPHDKSYFALKHFCNKHSNSLLIDIGANSGISALSFRRLNKNIPIFSIEPNPIHKPSLDKLKNKIFPFEYLLQGVGSKEQEITLYTPAYKCVVLHTFSSSSEEQIKSAVLKNFGSKIANNIKIHKSHVKISPLDTFNLKPSIIKIDAEGFDYDVLLGAQHTIKANRPFLMVEACHSDIERFNNFFAELDYKMYSYDYKSNQFWSFNSKSLNNVSGGRNIFAIPEEKIALLPILR